MFVITEEPTDLGLSDAPIIATEPGRNILARLRMDTAVPEDRA
jgi:hypothetical protein